MIRATAGGTQTGRDPLGRAALGRLILSRLRELRQQLEREASKPDSGDRKDTESLPLGLPLAGQRLSSKPAKKCSSDLTKVNKMTIAQDFQ